ncbi:MAG: methylmalonyl-CoA mutase [Candidatus Entotheonella factor]|uniref:Methylmalonyl-CoA mutase n=1 Tax=Entotheonella factor TaxID=1429438 RepID=W4LQI6_ENTF1|nr:MAG: methylmalonyl-CoA mutase [Candidatus Entotheonella factor]
MAESSSREQIAQAYNAWSADMLQPAEAKTSGKTFETLSEIPIEPLATPLDQSEDQYLDQVGFPGQQPFTRGVQPTMYRGRLWTTRIFAGFGTAEETNQRYKYLLAEGNGGLSVAFDLPALYGYDPDHPMSAGEVGKCGVAVSSLADMEVLFDDIPLDQVSTSMTITSTAAIALAMYVAVAEKQGVKPEQLRGTVQNDILKEYIAQKEWIFPPRPSMRLVRDSIAYCAEQLPQWNAISISGYHIREAGATAVQELAFTLYDGLTYVQEMVEAGWDVDSFAPRLSFFWDVHSDFFEEIAKFRAARRIWAREIESRYHPKDPRSLLLRTHAQTAGVALTAQQPQNNIVRVALQALAAVMGGTQSLHTNALDEALALPTEETARIALRTQQILASEAGVTDTIDPLGGSYYLEKLTYDMEQQVYAYFKKLDELGGMVRAIELGYPQREIGEAAYRYQRKLETQDEIVVGVNRYTNEEEPSIDILTIEPHVEKEQIERVQALRQSRDDRQLAQSLSALRQAASGDENLMPYILDAVRAYGTFGEISDVLREVWGTYEEPTAAFSSL